VAKDVSLTFADEFTGHICSRPACNSSRHIIAMTTLTPRSELLISLERHNATFTTLLSLIPPRYYITPTPEEVCPTLNPSKVGLSQADDWMTVQADNRWMKSKKRKTGEELKEHKRRVKLDKVGFMTIHAFPRQDTGRLISNDSSTRPTTSLPIRSSPPPPLRPKSQLDPRVGPSNRYLLPPQSPNFERNSSPNSIPSAGIGDSTTIPNRRAGIRSRLLGGPRGGR